MFYIFWVAGNQTQACNDTVQLRFRRWLARLRGVVPAVHRLLLCALLPAEPQVSSRSPLGPLGLPEGKQKEGQLGQHRVRDETGAPERLERTNSIMFNLFHSFFVCPRRCYDMENHSGGMYVYSALCLTPGARLSRGKHWPLPVPGCRYLTVPETRRHR